MRTNTMSKLKKAKVVMLPSNEKATIGDLGLSKNVLNFAKNNDWINIYNPIKQHIYIISDDEIKENDWYLDTSMKSSYYGLHKCDSKRLEAITKEFKNVAKKIIASTDESLNNLPEKPNFSSYMSFSLGNPLPQPSQQFIQKFVEEYNKGNVITDVLVEYNIYDDQCDGLSCGICNCNPTTEKLISELKINQKDNSLNICFID